MPFVATGEGFVNQFPIIKKPTSYISANSLDLLHILIRIAAPLGPSPRGHPHPPPETLTETALDPGLIDGTPMIAHCPLDKVTLVAFHVVSAAVLTHEVPVEAVADALGGRALGVGAGVVGAVKFQSAKEGSHWSSLCDEDCSQS